jgi:hypothetical protein
VTRARQAPVHRAARLRDGRCPVHGLELLQVDGWWCPDHGPDEACPSGCRREPFTVVGCPRGDCRIEATMRSTDGPAVLSPAFAFLLRD